MKHWNLLLACVLASCIGADAKPPAKEPVPKVTPAAKPKWPQIAWGEPVRGLQLGAIAVVAEPPQMSTTVRFQIVLRNVSKKPITVVRTRATNLYHPPAVERLDKKPLSVEQKDAVRNFAGVSAFNLSGPAWKEELILQPWQTQTFGADWTMEPIKGSPASGLWAWGLWTPGKYNFTFSMALELPTRVAYAIPGAPIAIKSKPVTVEFLADAPEPAPIPKPH